MLNPKINLGPLEFHFYGLIIAIAIYTGWFLAKKRAHVFKIKEKDFDDPILFLPLFFAIIGARFYHVIDYWHIYSKDPILILNISAGGLGIWGALFGTFLGFVIVSKIKKINLLTILNIASPSMILGQAIGRFGNYINQEGFGPPTNLPWGVLIEKQARPIQFTNYSYFHPTFFYEAIIDLIIFAILFNISKNTTTRGKTFAYYLMLYGLSRFIVEFFRIDTAIVSGIKVAQILSGLSVVLGIILILKTRHLDTD